MLVTLSIETMKKYHYCLIMAGVFYAPHIPDWLCLTFGIIFTISAACQLIKDQ